jgi:hypothetical protein
MKKQTLVDYNTYEIIHCIFSDLKMSFKEMNNENFNMFKNIDTWQQFTFKFFNKNDRPKYKYFMTFVLKDKNFCNNFNNIMKMELEDIEKETKRIKTFYRNSYILFLLSIKSCS